MHTGFAQPDSAAQERLFRPTMHFTPKAHWMNDPNGMIYMNRVWHLFFQYYPAASVWGPMHWGHATSTDLVNWKEQPIALYPDSLGYIFSGSAVWDKNNTSGLGKNGKGPLVAIFTHHDPINEGKTAVFQNQSIAYSNDEGKTWIKYAGNPVVKNPGIVDFRDPKVRWFEAGKKWIMTLATKDRISFYSSPDLKSWVKESEFGATIGAHGGVWECPDLFPLAINGKTYWILIVSIGSGAPNGGSGTQYFIGQFNGKVFTPIDEDIRWIDYGPDNYAGVTWSNTPGRTVFLGWMSNWAYAQQVPTTIWRSANTIPRDLGLKQVGNKLYLKSLPSKEVDAIWNTKIQMRSGGHLVDSLRSGDLVKGLHLPARVDLSLDLYQDFALNFYNDKGESVTVGYEKNSDQYFIDRSQSGLISFHKEFGKRNVAPRKPGAADPSITVIIDKSSVELFTDDGATVLTSLYFPNEPFSHLNLQLSYEQRIRHFIYAIKSETGSRKK